MFAYIFLIFGATISPNHIWGRYTDNSKEISKNTFERENELIDFMTPTDYADDVIKTISRQGKQVFTNNQSIKRSRGGHKENLCEPRDVIVSTYTFERGSQHPRTVAIQRCQGGIKNPENYQCQPSKIQIKCFATTNDWGETDFIGTFEHTGCEERCICNRKNCAGKKLYDLQCPLGFVEKKSRCQCVSASGISIFHRNMGATIEWSKDLHKMCKKHGADLKINGGQAFVINS